MSAIRRLLTDCLVRLSGAGAAGGTGFFVAPGTVLTCAHVVAGLADGETLRADWNGDGAPARIKAVHPASDGRTAPYPYPDLALLEVERSGHPCVRLDLDEPRWEERVHGGGYTHTWSAEQAQVQPVTFTYEGVHEVGGGLLMLAGGQAVPGMSGGPLLNLRTMGVCGVLRSTRDPDQPAGGWGVPAGLLRELHPEVLAAHDAFHRTDRRWREAADAVTPLLAGLPALGASFAGRIENFLVEYLGRDGAGVPFGGRDPQMRELSAWLSDPHAAPYALVAAEAGRGKSALLVRWAQEVQRQEQAHVVVVPVSIRFNTAQAGVVFPALAARLGEVYGEPPAGADMSAEQWKEVCLNYLRRPPPGDRLLLVVMDGLDEATDWHPGPDLFPASPAKGVRVLASARHLAGDTDGGGWLARLNWDAMAVSLPLPPMDRDGVRQVLHAMGDPLAGLASKVDVVSELYRLSDGDPLLVRLYVEALLPYGERVAAISLDELPSISRGLEGYFERWWDEQERQWRSRNRNSAAEREDLEDFLNALACALGPLSRDDLAGILPRPLSGLRLKALAEEVGRFVIGDGRETGFVFSHPRLGMFFRELMGQGERGIWDARFLAYGRRALDQAREGATVLPPYAGRFYGAHLERAAAPDEDLFALVDGSWLRACQTLEGTDSTFLTDCDRAWRRAESRRTERAFEVRFRCALAHASVAARSDGIPAPLLDAAVRAEIITQAQALALCRRMTNEQRCAAAVVSLAGVVEAEWIDECVAVAGTLRTEGRRAHTLADLSPRLSERSARRALSVARSLTSPGFRAVALAALSTRLPDVERTVLAREALDSCASDEEGYRRGRALLVMAAHLPRDLLPEAVRLARRTPDPLTAIRALSALARHLPEPDARAAVEAARARQGELPSDSHVVRARFALAEFASPAERDRLLPSLARVAPNVARNLVVEARSWIGSTDADRWPAHFESNLLHRPSGAPEQLVAVLPAPIRRRLRTDLMRRMSDLRIEHLLLLARLLALEEDDEARRGAVEDLLRWVRFSGLPERAAVLTVLAACHSGRTAAELLREALDSAQLIDDVDPRIAALSGVATDGSEQALADLQSDLVFRPGRLGYVELRSFLDGSGVPMADGAVDAAVEWVRRDRIAPLAILELCARRASEQARFRLGTLALMEALAIEDAGDRSRALRRLAVHLPELRPRIDEEQRRALERIQTFEHRLTALTGTQGMAGALSTTEDKERLIRESVVPLLTEFFDLASLRNDGGRAFRQQVESLFDELPQNLSGDLGAQLWDLTARAEAPLGPWLLVRLMSRLPAEHVPDAVARLRKVRFYSDFDSEAFRHTLAEELTRAFSRLDPAARSLLLDDALDRPVSPDRLRVLLPLAGADRLPDILSLVRELPFSDAVAAAGELRRYADGKSFGDFVDLLMRIAERKWPFGGLTDLIGLVHLVDRTSRGALLDRVTRQVAERKPREWPKALWRLPVENRATVARRLLSWKVREPWELTPVIAFLPAEGLRYMEKMVRGIEEPSLRLGPLGELIAAAGRPTPDRLWAEVLRAVREDTQGLSAPQGLLGLLQCNLPEVDDRWVQELRAVIDGTTDPEERVTLLCALARHARPPRRCELLRSALDTVHPMTSDRIRAAALLPVVQSARECPEVVEQTLEAISSVHWSEGRQRALEGLLPAMQAWAGSGTADTAPWDRALRQLSRRPRPLVVRDMGLLAQAGAGFLPDDRGVPRAFLAALHWVGGCWT